jgi:NAD-dependent SIR2 family protein deacetylase
MKNASIINKIVDAIRKNNLSVFVGAGLSKSAGFPDWKELVNEIVNELGLDVKKETDMISLVQYAYNSKRKNRNYINELIKNTFLDDSKSSINMNILGSPYRK